MYKQIIVIVFFPIIIPILIICVLIDREKCKRSHKMEQYFIDEDDYGYRCGRCGKMKSNIANN